MCSCSTPCWISFYPSWELSYYYQNVSFSFTRGQRYVINLQVTKWPWWSWGMCCWCSVCWYIIIFWHVTHLLTVSVAAFLNLDSTIDLRTCDSSLLDHYDPNCVFVEPIWQQWFGSNILSPFGPAGRMNPQWLLCLTMSMLHIEEHLCTDQWLIQEAELSSVLYYLNTLVQLHRNKPCLAATSARALPLASVVLVVRCAFTLITANFFGIFMANIKSFTNPACLMGDPAEVRNFLVCQMTPNHELPQKHTWNLCRYLQPILKLACML